MQEIQKTHKKMNRETQNEGGSVSHRYFYFLKSQTPEEVIHTFLAELIDSSLDFDKKETEKTITFAVEYSYEAKQNKGGETPFALVNFLTEKYKKYSIPLPKN